MRFWQKTYLLTLALFLFCLNTGIFGLAYYIYNENVRLAEKAAGGAASYAMLSFERDMRDISAQNSVTLLMQSYGGYYKNRDALVGYYNSEGNPIYSTLPEGFSVENGALTHRDIVGKRHIVVSQSSSDGEYVFVYAENAEGLDRDFKRIMIIFALTSLGVSALLATVLFFVLKRLSVPLDKLKATTERIAVGDFSARADDKGSDEFALLGTGFNIMLDRIDDQMNALSLEAERKQSLVDNMAHELRTPLTGIRGYAEYLRVAAISDEECAEVTEYIINECKRLQSLSEKILETARITADGIEKEAVSLMEIAEETVVSLKPKSHSRGVSLTVEGDDHTVFGDKALLCVLMYNLADNAVKACKEGGKVVISCKEGGFSVSDNGKGIEKEKLSRLTEPFYRTDKARSREEGGVGLGLSLCDTVAKAHGARLSFDSAPGKGTTVFVEGLTT